MSAKTLANARGSVFLSTMICTLLMTMVGGYTYKMTSANTHFVNQIRKSTQAQQLADAGLNKALAQIRSNWSAVSGAFAAASLGSGSYSTTVVSSGGRYLVKTTGTVQGVSRIASAEVLAPTTSALDYVFAGGSVGNHVIDSGTGQSSGSITGDIYMAGNLTLDGPPSGGTLSVNGTVYTQGTTTTGSNVSVSGSTTSNWTTTVSFPTVDFSFYQAIATANGTYISSDVTYASGAIPANPAGGVIFVDGDVTIHGTQSTTACIVATGNISVAKSGSTYPRVTINQYSNYPALLTQTGNISFVSTGNGGAYLNTTGLVYSGNNFSLSSGNHDTFSFTGSVLALGTISSSGLTAWNNVTAGYVQQTPPGMEYTDSSSMTVRSYNS